MKRLLLTALLTLGLPPALLAADTRPFGIRDLVMMERVSDPQVSPDGRHVAYVLRTTDLDGNKGLRAIWLYDTKTRLQRKLSTGGGNAESPRWAAKGSTLYFLSSRSGSNQVWKQSLSGEATAVTQLPLEVSSFKLVPQSNAILLSMDVFTDCDTLACSKTRFAAQAQSKASGQLYDRLFVRHWDSWKNGSRSQLFVGSLKNETLVGEPRGLTRGIDGDVPSKPFGDDRDYTLTPDGKTLIFSARNAGRSEAWSTNFDLYMVPLDGHAKPVNLTADNPAWDHHPIVTPDGRSVIYLAQTRAGFEADRFHILIRNLSGGAPREIAPRWDRSPDSIALSENGSTLYATAADQGQTPLFAINVSGGGIKRLTAAGTVSAFSLSSDGLVYALNTLSAPDDLYRIAWNGITRQLTHHNAERLAGIDMAAYEPFKFNGASGDSVSGYVMKPAGYRAGQRYPVAFIIHGGPQTSMGNKFHYRWNPQVFAGMGYAAVFIDFHGSVGYGQAFTDSISGDWGGKPLEDLKKGWAAALKQYDFLDGDKACALGASYGGYMVNWIAGNWRDSFRCLVNHDGVFDTRMMAYSTEELWFDEWEHGGTPYDRPEAHERHNPVNHVKQWKTPMLVIHSLNDHRVPIEQGLATFTALQRRGIDSQLLYFPDENHWVQKPQNSIQWYDTVQAWMDRWLKTQP